MSGGVIAMETDSVLFRSLEEEQKLSPVCVQRRASSVIVRHGPAGVGRLYLVSQSPFEGVSCLIGKYW